jgi:hypothetical protein
MSAIVKDDDKPPNHLPASGCCPTPHFSRIDVVSYLQIICLLQVAVQLDSFEVFRYPPVGDRLKVSITKVLISIESMVR